MTKTAAKHNSSGRCHYCERMIALAERIDTGKWPTFPETENA